MDISIIIVNYNTRDLLRNCLKSIFDTVLDISYEIIVVDNASSDGSTAMLEEEFPSVTIIKNAENRGFGAANNQAFRIMKGRYALLLNTDTILTDQAVKALFTFMESNPSTAMACGQLLNADGTKQNSIAAYPTLLTLLFNAAFLEYLFPTQYPSKRHDYKEPIEIDSGIGACLMVSKNAIDDVGMFDERYFFFFEETDWARVMRSKGWKIYHVPAARIYHLQGQSIGRDVHSREEFYRSRYQYFRKWNSGPVYVLLSCAVFIRLIMNWLLTAAANLFLLGMHEAIRDKLKIYSRLILWHLKGCPIVTRISSPPFDLSP
jgi:GT2 family glycosyltransferase